MKSETLGDRLTAEMKRRKAKNPDVARAAGVHATTVSKWRTDAQVPDEEQLAKAADFLGVSSRWLRTGKDYVGVVRESAPVIWPAEARVLAQELALEATRAGATDEEIEVVKSWVLSPKLAALWHGGQPEGDAMKDVRAAADAARSWLRARGREV